MRRVLLAVPILILLVLPVQSFADASVVQDSCVEVGPNLIRIYFTVINVSLPAPVCDLHFIAEPQPPAPECAWVGCGHPLGWSCFLNPFGAADFFANTPVDCIDAGSAKGGYYFDVDPAYCCYIVQFTDPTGAVMLEQEECFTLCKPLATEEKSWGEVKDDYNK